ncbi:MAG: collagen-like protein [Dehalococcoidia bacterium]
MTNRIHMFVTAILGISMLFVTANLADAVEPDEITACSVDFLFFGSVRFVDGPGDCYGWEEAVTWNQEGVEGPQGIQGEKGDKGDTGDAGPAGENGVSGYEVVRQWANGGASALRKKDWAGENALELQCPDDKLAIGGGYNVSGLNDDEKYIVIADNFPGHNGVFDPHWWRVSAFEASGDPEWDFEVYVICAAIPHSDAS